MVKNNIFNGRNNEIRCYYVYIRTSLLPYCLKLRGETEGEHAENEKVPSRQTFQLQLIYLPSQSS